MDLFLRFLLDPIEKYVVSYFPPSEGEALQIDLKFDLIYAQLGYVYTVIPDLPQLGAVNALGASHATDDIVEPFHTLYYMLHLK